MISYFKFDPKMKKTMNYSQIFFGKLKETFKKIGSDEENQPTKVAEMIITKDNKSNGLMEDLELVIQLIIDQSTLKLKAISKSGITLSHTLVNLVDFNKPVDNNSL
jgi:hypothetical protein